MMTSMTHLPRSTGDVRPACDVSVSTLRVSQDAPPAGVRVRRPCRNVLPGDPSTP